MLDVISMYARRLLPVRTVKGALSQFISPRLVAACDERLQAGDCLISAAALESQRDPLTTLYEVADRLDITPCEELGMPERDLLERTGHSAELLRELGVVPQVYDDGPEGYKLVIADPRVVDTRQYRERGIEVQLTLGSYIDEAWERYSLLESQHREQSISDEQFESVMLQLAHDALDKGASEVFVGHPETSGYEFLVGEQRYTGRLDPQVYGKLLQYFTAEGRLQHRISRNVVSSKISELTFALTKNVNNPVVYLSWRPNSEATAKPLQVAERSEAKQNHKMSLTEPRAARSERAAVSSDSRSILLVDDDERFGSLLVRILRGRGFEVHRCENGQAALDYLQESDFEPSLIISDVHMPTMDGVTFLRKIRKVLPVIPVLMLTSDEDELLQVELVELGANAFVRKQDDIKILIAWCNNLIATKDDSFKHVVRLSA